MKQYRLKSYFFSVLIILFVLVSNACNNKADTVSDSIIIGKAGSKLDMELTPICQHIMSSNDLSGLAVGIVKNSEIIYAKCFGYETIETKEPVSLSTLFHMASISKPFVATAIMQLVEQGKIDLESTVITYLPYFKLDGEHYDEITIKQMLNHISGMPDVEGYEWNDPVYDAGALERYVRSLSSEKMRSIPGEEFSYSNMAFECLGDVIAKVSGISFADYVKQYILNPAGMKESTFLKPESLPENWASPHFRFITIESWDGYPYNRKHGPSSTLHSNILEMCNWTIINLNHGTYNGSKILDSKSYEILWNPWFNIGGNRSIGLSWFLGNYRNEVAVSHGGGDKGFNTDLVLIPEKSIAVVVMCNFNPAPVHRIKDAALDIIFGYDPATYPDPAIIPVSKELELNGLDAAVSMWDSLSTHHVENYDFTTQLFYGLYMAFDMNRVNEAELLTSLFINILDEENLDKIRRETESLILEYPEENSAAVAALKVIQGNKTN